jgi:hypothetical protein
MTQINRNKVIPNPGLLFLIHSNEVFAFEIGERGNTAYWLRGQVVRGAKGHEPLFYGRLFMPIAVPGGIVIDSFPKATTPRGWEKRLSINPTGYDLVHTETGEVILGYRVHGDRCQVSVHVYDERGAVVAENDGETLLIHRGPAFLPPLMGIAA